MTKWAKKIIQTVFVLGGTAALLCALPSYAFAEQASGIEVLLPNMNEFIPMLIAFIIVVIILSKFGFPVLERIIEEREDKIRKSLEESEAARIESERLLQEYKDKLAAARQEAHDIVYEAQQSGDEVIKEMTSQAHEEADSIITKAHKTIELDKKTAVADLQDSVSDLVVAVTARVIDKDFSDTEHRKLIEKSISEVGNINA